MKKYFIFAHQVARSGAKQCIDESPDGYGAEIGPINRTKAQNAKLHALIGQIAKTQEWAGKKHSIETWKRLLTASWLRARGEPIEMLPALDGMGVDIVYRPTSELNINVMIEEIEYVTAWAVEQGINV